MPKRKTVSTFENDPTPHRVAQSGDTGDTFKTDSGRRVRRLNSVLDLLLSKKSIDGRQYTAGQTAYHQWYIGGLSPPSAVDLSQERVDGSPGAFSDRRLDNACKFQKAFKSLCMAHRHTFTMLVCHEQDLTTFGQDNYAYSDKASARAAAVASLRDTLNSLDDHYNGPRYLNPSPIRSQMAPDAKPANRPDARNSGAV